MRVLAAISGGVDSAVAAARMLDHGHSVTAVHLLLERSERSAAAERDARSTAELLGIEFQLWDFTDRFAAEVKTYFLDEYAAGRTPNPCLRCNRTVKFGALLERGRELGYELVATGHYARLTRGDQVELRRAADMHKDQSYVLGVLNQDQLQHALFPLGDTTKSAVRQEAAQRGLFVADKADSTDICFIPDGDTSGFLRRNLGERPGRIVDETGTALGTHTGSYQFTVGQRRGLHLGIPAADGQPRFVVQIDPKDSTVTVGSRSALAVTHVQGTNLTWTGAPRLSPWQGLAQLRAHGDPVPATFDATPDSLTVTLDAMTFGIAAGQSVVCYDGDQVIGSATITSATQ